ncbi:hypothetical protein SRB5_34070 [Streptomyces sp. RB5]|uniref:Chaplin domain-containing protein n=1 Tax=Streptomyces smaragdinus TaxID=2585196 RepID=A0A7K0CIU5_9ACTN|nr:chaplin [Streptomyces smaragdinus]MQY13263.1 hypothetical protein [Streptomyces smaragdinus]
MRHVARKSLLTVAAAGGVLAVTGGAAFADSGADGTANGSPGIVSGNAVQAPIHIPVNVCGNTVNVIGLLNPASGNDCANSGGGTRTAPGGGSSAEGSAKDSPGIGSGNVIQAPVDVPVNVCGNSVNVVGAGNAALGNSCENVSHGHRRPPGTPENPPGTPENPPGTPENPPGTPENPPGTPETPPGTPGTPETPGTPDTPAVPEGPTQQLAQTGSGLPLGVALPAVGGLLLGGTVLYRRARSAA